MGAGKAVYNYGRSLRWWKVDEVHAEGRGELVGQRCLSEQVSPALIVESFPTIIDRDYVIHV